MLVSKALLARLVDTLNVQCSCFKKRFINNLRKCTDLILIAIFCVQDMCVTPVYLQKAKVQFAQILQKQRPQFRVFQISF